MPFGLVEDLLAGETEQGICPILFFEVEGLFLDILGLVVELDLILEITADPEGGLLGALLEGLLC